MAMRELARRFGVTINTAHSVVRDFKADFEDGAGPQFFAEPVRGPKSDREKIVIREHVLRLRARGYASTDIHKALRLGNMKASLSLVDHVLREAGLSGLGKRAEIQRRQAAEEIQARQVPGLTIPPPPVARAPEVADVRRLDIRDGRSFRAQAAGVFLFIPFLVQAGLDKIAGRAGMAGSKMIPPVGYLLSLLRLKLLDKERKSHIADWSFDQGAGLWAGLNYPPKITAATDYTYRLAGNQHNRLLSHWVKSVYPILCPDGASCFALDFHAIPHRSAEPEMESHYVPSKGKASPSILARFARSVDAPMLCYGNADIVNAEEKTGMVAQFVRYWNDVTGVSPDWLYFDSKTTTYAELSGLNANPGGRINFVTIRRRGGAMVDRILRVPDAQWRKATINTPQRRNQKISLLDSKVRLPGYDGVCRQIAVKGLGRAQPTLFLTNNEDAPERDVVVRHINRNHIENDIGINVNFFHMDCLSSQVRLNVSLDVVMTVIANGCYRWLSQKLKGCGKMEPKRVCREFIDTTGVVSINGEKINVSLDRRSHNPILAQAELDAQPVHVPWLGNKVMRFYFA